MTLVKYTVTVQPFCDNWQTSENAIEVATVKRKQRSLRTSCKTARDGSVLGNDGDSSTQIKMCGPPRWCIKLWDITHRECASCGILWCRRTSQCRRRANRRVSGYTARSFLCCDKRIQVTFPSSILSDYVHMNWRRVVCSVSVLCVRNCLIQHFCWNLN